LANTATVGQQQSVNVRQVSSVTIAWYLADRYAARICATNRSSTLRSSLLLLFQRHSLILRHCHQEVQLVQLHSDRAGSQRRQIVQLRGT
uniref:Secreted protein n=1 Tax=Gongylonema pulchrum TaxID=637853 RepID=A0A183EG07_9BILA